MSQEPPKSIGSKGLMKPLTPKLKCKSLSLSRSLSLSDQMPAPAELHRLPSDHNQFTVPVCKNCTDPYTPFPPKLIIPHL